jgi:DNA invertase Pin-like site-specific DNA recombinase
MTKVSIYARYSCDKQSETSLEDQIRRCRQLAEANKLVVDDALIYTDAAVSGTDKGEAARDGYRRLRQDWDASKFDVLLVDEFSRLSRDPVEQALLFKRLENNRRVRLITADGIDTQDADWHLRLGLQGLLSQYEGRKLSHRVDRGMVGQLKRGYMVATPAYGYDLDRKYDSQEEHVGSHWRINPMEAAVVQKVFAQREAGDSMHQIAARLNSEGVLCSRKARKKDGGHWRASRVKIMLGNPVYKGIFVWHGSTTYAAKMKSLGLPVITEEFERPELRLVSDETWQRCNERSISRSGYGGGLHALSGLLTCGCCGGTLALSALKRCRSVYCPACTEAKSSKLEDDRQTSTVAAVGVEVMLKHALTYYVSKPFLEAFRNALRLRLTGGQQAEVEECEGRLSKLRLSQERLSRMLVNLTVDDDVLQKRYEETRQKVAQTAERLAKLKVGLDVVNTTVAQLQLQTDPRKYLQGLFEAEHEPQRLRAVLARLFPSIVFEGKTGRYTSHFKIRFAPGVAIALASGTEAITSKEIEARFMLKYWPSNRNTYPPKWTVDTLEMTTCPEPVASP